MVVSHGIGADCIFTASVHQFTSRATTVTSLPTGPCCKTRAHWYSI